MKNGCQFVKLTTNNLVPSSLFFSSLGRWKKEVKQSVGREWWQGVLILAVTKIVGFKSSSSRYLIYRSLMWNFADEERSRENERTHPRVL